MHKQSASVSFSNPQIIIEENHLQEPLLSWNGNWQAWKLPKLDKGIDQLDYNASQDNLAVTVQGKGIGTGLVLIRKVSRSNAKLKGQ